MKSTRRFPFSYTGAIVGAAVYVGNLVVIRAGTIATTIIAAEVLAALLAGIAIGSYYATRR